MNDTTQQFHKPDDKILERIRQLLAMSQDKSSPQEAAIAAERAQKLMEKYNIDAAESILRDLKTQQAIDRVDITGTISRRQKVRKEVPSWAQDLAIQVAGLFDCYVVIADNPVLGKCLRFIGYKVDAEVCQWTFTYLVDQLRRLNHKFRRLHVGQTQATAAYREGVIYAFKMALREAKRQKDERNRVNSTSTALVVAKDAAITQYLGYTPRYRTTHKSVGDYNAYARGVADGKNVNVNPTAVRDKRDAPKTLK